MGSFFAGNEPTMWRVQRGTLQAGWWFTARTLHLSCEAILLSCLVVHRKRVVDPEPTEQLVPRFVQP